MCNVFSPGVRYFSNLLKLATCLHYTVLLCNLGVQCGDFRTFFPVGCKKIVAAIGNVILHGNAEWVETQVENFVR